MNLDKNTSFNEDSLVGGTERSLKIEDGMIGTKYNNRHYYFITAQLASNPFEENTQVQLEESWQKWSNQLMQTTPGLELTYTAVSTLCILNAERDAKRYVSYQCWFNNSVSFS